MNMSQAVVVIPIYSEHLSATEQVSLNRVLSVLAEYPIYYVAPMKLKNFLASRSHKVEYFPDGCFSSVKSYSSLLLAGEFYNRFSNFEYMLICQLDAFVFVDRLKEFCDKEYDYIGASWEHWNYYYVGNKKYHSYVGNGGFSLRKIKSFIRVLEQYQEVVSEWRGPEDVFFAFCGDYLDDNFSVAPREMAWHFAFETYPRYIYEKINHELPFGCHAWNRADKEFYMSIMQQCGVDLSTCESDMASFPLCVDHLDNDDLGNEGILLYRMFYNDILRQYTKPWFFVCLDSYGCALANRLLETNTVVKDEVYGYVRDITPYETIFFEEIILKSKEALCVLCGLENASLLTDFNNSLVYGKNYISLTDEYKKHVLTQKAEVLHPRWSFPFYLFERSSRIVIYGAGHIGISYYEQATESNKVNIVGIADKRANNDFFFGVPVMSIEKITQTEFDFILIAAERDETIHSIRDTLKKMHVPAEKIVCEKTTR